MQRFIYISLLPLLAAASFAFAVAPQTVLAQYYGPTSQLVITSQTGSGTTLPPASIVTVSAAGASLSATPSSTGSLAYSTNFANDTKVITMISGNYSISVAPVSGYTYTYSSGCVGAVSSGSTAVCTITVSNYGSGSATLTVYTNVNAYPSSTNAYYPGYNNNYGAYSPQNFTVSVTGTSPSPQSFQGSSSGTTVTLGPGPYSVTSANLVGWSAQESGACSGTAQTGQSLSCTVTYTYGTNGYNYPYSNYYGSLSCIPSYSQVPQGGTATFTAIGGTGTYAWTTPSQTFVNSGPILNTILQNSGAQSVEVSSASQTATCSITVVPGGAYIASPLSQNYTGGYGYTYPSSQNYSYTPPPASTSYYAPSAVVQGGGYVTSLPIPSLPNTGFEPQDGAGIAFAAVALMAAAIILLPYARKTLAALRG